MKVVRGDIGVPLEDEAILAAGPPARMATGSVAAIQMICADARMDDCPAVIPVAANAAARATIGAATVAAL